MKFSFSLLFAFISFLPLQSQLTQLEAYFPLYKTIVPSKEPQVLPQTVAINDQMYSFANVTGVLEYFKGPDWETLPKNQFVIHSYQSTLDNRLISKPFGLFRGSVVNTTIDSLGNLYLTTTAKLFYSSLPKKKKFEKVLDSDSIYVTCVDPKTLVKWSKTFGVTNESNIQFHSFEFKGNQARIYFQSKDTLYQHEVNQQGVTESIKKYVIPANHKVSFIKTNLLDELIVLTTRVWPQYEISLEEQHLLLSFSIVQTLKWKEYISGTRFEVFVKSLLVDSKGTIYIVGNFLKEITSNFTTIKSKGQQDIFIIKVSSQGKTISVHGIGGSEGDNLSAATISQNNDLIFSGQMYGRGTVLNEVLDNNGKAFTFLAKISEDNRVVFAKVFGDYSVSYHKITEDHFKRILLVGMFSDTLQTRNGDILVSKGGTDFYFSLYDDFGNMEAVEPFGTSGDEAMIIDYLLTPNRKISLISYTSTVIQDKKQKEYSLNLWRYKYQR